jgi:hypothetical protein
MARRPPEERPGVAEHLGEGLRRLRPVHRRLGQCVEDRLLHLHRHRVPHHAHARHLLHQVLRHDGHGVGAGERRLAGEHLVEHAAERVDVGGRPDLVPRRLLGGHVHRRPDRHARLRELLTGGIVGRARDAEVGDERVLAREEDVLRLDVAVDDPLLVRVVERAADLEGDAERVLDGEHPFAVEPVAGAPRPARRASRSRAARRRRRSRRVRGCADAAAWRRGGSRARSGRRRSTPRARDAAP